MPRGPVVRLPDFNPRRPADGKTLETAMVRASMILSALLATAGFATAGSTHYTDPEGVVRFELHDTACTGATREVLREEYVTQFHRAVITVGTTVVNAFWFGPDEAGDLVIINEAGQGMTVPAKSLKKVPSA